MSDSGLEISDSGFSLIQREIDDDGREDDPETDRQQTLLLVGACA